MKRISLPHWLTGSLLGIAVVTPSFAQDTPPAEAEQPAVIETAPAPPAPPAQPPLDIKDPVATVNGDPVTRAELEEMFNNAVSAQGVDPATLSNEQKLAGYNQLLQDMITEKLVKAAAEDVTVTDADVDAEIAKIREQFPTQEAFEQQLEASGQTEDKLKALIKEGLSQRKWVESQTGEIKISDEEAKKFYDDNSAEFERPEMVKASHILFMVPEGASEDVLKEKEEAAKSAAAEAKKDGADFGELAKNLSEEPGADERGGDLGLFSKDQMVPAFADAAFSMEPGEISDPIKTEFGFHVIKVAEKQAAGKTPFEEVKPDLVTFLTSQKGQEEVGKVLEKLRADAEIEVFLPQPPSPMSGAMGAPDSAQPAPSEADAPAADDASEAATTEN